MGKQLLDPGETIDLTCAFPYVIEVYFMDSWVTYQYALTEKAAEELMKPACQTNSVPFTILKNQKYSPEARDAVIAELEEYRDALLSTMNAE